MLVRSFGAIAPAKVSGGKASTPATKAATPAWSTAKPQVAAKAQVKAAPRSAVQRATPLSMSVASMPPTSSVSAKPTNSAQILPTGMTKKTGTAQAPNGLTSSSVGVYSAKKGASVAAQPSMQAAPSGYAKKAPVATNLHQAPMQPTTAPTSTFAPPSAMFDSPAPPTTAVSPSYMKPSAGPAMSTQLAPSGAGVSPTLALSQQSDGMLMSTAISTKPTFPTSAGAEKPSFIPSLPAQSQNLPAMQQGANPLDSVAMTGGSSSSLPGEAAKAPAGAASAAAAPPPEEFPTGKVAIGVGILLGILAFAASSR